ncbi:MAG: TolC family protein [Alphaproteobacteria bacterium]
MAIAGIAPWCGATAEPLGDLIPGLLKSSEKIVAAQADLDAARERVNAAYGGWYPDVRVVGWSGHEHYRNPNQEHLAKEMDLTLTQLIYDFGKTDSRIETAKLAVAQSEAVLVGTRQGTLLEGATAYVNLFRYAEALNYARQSEDNIRKQTGLEKARVEKGGGYSTDVLQANIQLAGAEARRVRADFDYARAINKFRNVFGREPGKIETFRRVMPPPDLLPDSVDDVVKIAFDNNPSLKASFLTTLVARESVTQANAEGYYPKLEAIADIKLKQSVSGTLGNKKEQTYKGQFTWPFNLGFTAANTIKAAEYGVVGAETRFADARATIEEQIRNSWFGLITAKAAAELQRNQASMAEIFLDLARKERQLGTRSLIDVLSNETNHINAVSDALGAEADVVVQTLTMLAVMGRLDTDIITRIAQYGIAAPPKKKKKADQPDAPKPTEQQEKPAPEATEATPG